MTNIIVPYTRKQFEYLLQESEDWGIALLGYTREIKYHAPKHPILEFIKETAVIFPQKCAVQPLEKATMIFTDGSSNGRAVVWSKGKPPIIKQTKKKKICAADRINCGYLGI